MARENRNPAHRQGELARAIEQKTAKLPSDVWLRASIASMPVWLPFQVAGKRDNALFVGQWAAPFSLLGVYNKIVRVEGSD